MSPQMSNDLLYSYIKCPMSLRYQASCRIQYRYTKNNKFITMVMLFVCEIKIPRFKGLHTYMWEMSLCLSLFFSL